jgi:hypothetical protein
VVDAAARDATTRGSLVPGVLSSDFNTALHQCILVKWQHDWDHIHRATSYEMWNQCHTHGGLPQEWGCGDSPEGWPHPPRTQPPPLCQPTPCVCPL